MSCLLIRLRGPLQSWGYRSRFTDRDTGTEPTKSGVVGLLCCALGQDRATDPAELAGLRMHVKVEREGQLLRDFHTVGGGVFRGSRAYFAPRSSDKPGKNTGSNPVVTERWYLQDASFLVALEGEREFLDRLAAALQDPVWPLSLGRKSCPPSVPVFVRVSDDPVEVALSAEMLPEDVERTRRRDKPVTCRMVWECEPDSEGSERRQDVPVRWPNSLVRDYGNRFVKQTVLRLEDGA